MIAKAYLKQKRKKILYVGILVVILIALLIISITSGSYNLSLYECFKALVFSSNSNSELVIWQMRLPQALTAAWLVAV